MIKTKVKVHDKKPEQIFQKHFELIIANVIKESTSIRLGVDFGAKIIV